MAASRITERSELRDWTSESSERMHKDLPEWLDDPEFAETFPDRQDWFKRFRHRKLEAHFAAEVSESCRMILRIAAFVWAGASLVELLIYGAPTLLLFPDIAGRYPAWGRICLFLFLLLAGASTWLRRVNPEVVVVFMCNVSLVILFINNPTRLKLVTGSSYYRDRVDAERLVCFEDNLLVLLMPIASCLSPTLIGIRLASSRWIYLVGNILYFATAPVGPLTIMQHAIVGSLYAVLCLLQAVGHGRLEGERRRRWLETLRLKISVAAHQQEIRDQFYRQREMEEQLEALTNGLSSMPLVTVSAGQKHQVGDEESVAPMRTVPTPSYVLYKLQCGASWVGQHGSKIPSPARSPVASEAPSPMLVQGNCATMRHDPNPMLSNLAARRQADPVRLRSMAERMRTADYSLGSFFEDCIATFPELDFFFAAEGSCSSGNSNAVEYQRTIGALFAVYWLVRLDIDGKQGFSFGYHSDWTIKTQSRHAKRAHFFEDMNWPSFEEVASLALERSHERLEAMLCLTAFHDIMKVTEFCPKVAEEYAPYHGYRKGETISDHDLALAYILEHYPDILPSYRILPPASREVVLFTQGKMHFNHGWFVQAEATPGHMLTQLKSILHRAKPGDFAFYFLHWITDLSGAEGQPLAGAEKFVVRFPRAVLESFMWSIPYLQHLHTRTETEVVETYLAARFATALPHVAVPTEPDYIALMRLVVMAQANAPLVLTSWKQATLADKRVLIDELSLTGISGQLYQHAAVDGGLAFFVYYGPALLQGCSSSDQMTVALSILASVYRAGRCLWAPSFEAGTIMLEIGAMKPMFSKLLTQTGSLKKNRAWVLLRRGDMEAAAVLATGRELNAYIIQQAAFTVLDIGDPQPYPHIVDCKL